MSNLKSSASSISTQTASCNSGMEQLILELNLPANQGNPLRINEIQKQIQRLQREQSAWQLGLDFLNHHEAIIQFYGALTLTIKINADWYLILQATTRGLLSDLARHIDKIGTDEAKQAYLLEALIGGYTQLALDGSAQFVLQKLCSTLAALHQQMGELWRTPVRHVIACLIDKHYVQQNSLPNIADIVALIPSQASTKQLTGTLRFVVTLAEDFQAKGSVGDEQNTVRISDNCVDSLAILNYCLEDYCHNKDEPGTSVPVSIELVEKCLLALPLWITQLKSHASYASKSETQLAHQIAAQCTKCSMACVERLQVMFAALQCLISVQQSSPKLLRMADPEFPQTIVKSDAVQRILNALQQGLFSAEGVLLVDLLDAVVAQVDLSSPEYILSGRYANVLQVLLTLLKCEGIAMIEDNICQVVLEMIVSVIEGYTDWDRDDGALEYLREFVRNACESCLEKIKMPPEEMNDGTQTWDTDDRARFQEFRLDVQDFLQSAFVILGPGLLEAIAQIATKDLPDSSWSDFEASIFCLMAFADTMSAEPESYNGLIEETLNSAHFKFVIQSPNVPDKARNTCIRFLTEVTAFLQQTPNLTGILNFLFSSLHQPSLLGSASRAIFTLCDAQRSSLTPALPDFLSSLGTIMNLRGTPKHRIYGGVAAVVQALPEEGEKLGPLITILDFILRTPTGEDAEDSGERRTSNLADVLQTLAAVGRGLRTPNDATLDPEPRPSVGADFWISGAGSYVQQRYISVYQDIIERTREGADNDLIEAGCDFLKSGFTEEDPSPFKFSSNKSTELVSKLISLDSPNIDTVMATASSLLASTDRQSFQPYIAQLLSPVNLGAQQILAKHRETGQLGDSNFPSAALDFVSRSLPKWVETVLSAEDGRAFLDLFVELSIVVISDPDTLPRRSAASFFSGLVDVSKPGKSLNEIAKHNLDAIMRTHSPRIVAVLLHLVGGECARSELEILTDPLRRYVLHQPMLFKGICREAVKDDSGIFTTKALSSTTLEQRLRFVSQMDALRGARKSNDAVKDFWIACRGSNFGYIA